MVLISSSNGIISIRVEHQTLTVFCVFSARTFACANAKCMCNGGKKKKKLEYNLSDSERKQQNSEVM